MKTRKEARSAFIGQDFDEFLKDEGIDTEVEAASATPRLGGAAGAQVRNERHRPEQTTLYRPVLQHAQTFFAHAEEATGTNLPQNVQGRVRRLPRLRHPGARLPAPALRRPGPRQAGRLQLQAPRFLPPVWRTLHGPDRCAPGRTRHPSCAGAPVGAGLPSSTADPAATAAGIATGTGDAGNSSGRIHSRCCHHSTASRRQHRLPQPLMRRVAMHAFMPHHAIGKTGRARARFCLSHGVA